MLTFNGILKIEGIDPYKVRLARHKTTKLDAKHSPYDLWRSADGRFERYQCIQRDPVFPVGDLVASFVVPPNNETLFVGVFVVAAAGKVPPGELDPVTENDVSGLILYRLERDNRLSQYEGKLVVTWGEGYRTWVQRAGKQDKPVFELRSKIEEPAFPGFMNLISQLSEIQSFPYSWKTTLAAVRGIYLLTCPKTKEQYVGSATGQGGFLQRWVDYVRTGHGGNVRLKSRNPSDYQVSILEVASSDLSDDEVVRREHLWMQKLKTKEMGLN